MENTIKKIFVGYNISLLNRVLGDGITESSYNYGIEISCQNDGKRNIIIPENNKNKFLYELPIIDINDSNIDDTVYDLIYFMKYYYPTVDCTELEMYLIKFIKAQKNNSPQLLDYFQELNECLANELHYCFCNYSHKKLNLSEIVTLITEIIDEKRIANAKR